MNFIPPGVAGTSDPKPSWDLVSPLNDFGGSGGAGPLSSCWQEGLPRAWSTVPQEP